MVAVASASEASVDGASRGLAAVHVVAPQTPMTPIDDDALPAEPTDAEVEAGAKVLERWHFLDGTQYPLMNWFDEDQQQSFREKARAVLIAAAAVRRG